MRAYWRGRRRHAAGTGAAPNRLRRSLRPAWTAALTRPVNSSPPRRLHPARRGFLRSTSTTRPTARTTPTAATTTCHGTTAARAPPTTREIRALRLRQMRNLAVHPAAVPRHPDAGRRRRVQPRRPAGQQQCLLPGQRTGLDRPGGWTTKGRSLLAFTQRLLACANAIRILRRGASDRRVQRGAGSQGRHRHGARRRGDDRGTPPGRRVRRCLGVLSSMRRAATHRGSCAAGRMPPLLLILNAYHDAVSLPSSRGGRGQRLDLACWIPSGRRRPARRTLPVRQLSSGRAAAVSCCSSYNRRAPERKDERRGKKAEPAPGTLQSGTL
ncbi:hypothetical protein ACPA9J_18450 [Pseudomonas aeruginosa]